jgi:hypothetical protein
MHGGARQSPSCLLMFHPNVAIVKENKSVRSEVRSCNVRRLIDINKVSLFFDRRASPLP